MTIFDSNAKQILEHKSYADNMFLQRKYNEAIINYDKIVLEMKNYNQFLKISFPEQKSSKYYILMRKALSCLPVLTTQKEYPYLLEVTCKQLLRMNKKNAHAHFMDYFAKLFGYGFHISAFKSLDLALSFLPNDPLIKAESEAINKIKNNKNLVAQHKSYRRNLNAYFINLSSQLESKDKIVLLKSNYQNTMKHSSLSKFLVVGVVVSFLSFYLWPSSKKNHKN